MENENSNKAAGNDDGSYNVTPHRQIDAINDRRKRLGLEPWTDGHSEKNGVAAFFGIWPGDETDAEFEAMVQEVRGT